MTAQRAQSLKTGYCARKRHRPLRCCQGETAEGTLPHELLQGRSAIIA